MKARETLIQRYNLEDKLETAAPVTTTTEAAPAVEATTATTDDAAAAPATEEAAKDEKPVCHSFIFSRLSE